MHAYMNRRSFLGSAAALGTGYWVAAGAAAEETTSPNERVAFACLGVGWQGQRDSRDAARHGDIVAVCETDDTRGRGPDFAKAKRYSDFRKMFDDVAGSIDAVVVSTPEHSHAAIALMAMRLGKHCFMQKPLGRTVYESRLVAQVARAAKIVTQMGNQGTAHSRLREGAAMLRAGVLGEIKELHVWTDRPNWPQAISRPKPETPPETLHWDLWLGPAPARPYAKGYHPWTWRGWWDFGVGALGNMGTHHMNLLFMGLDLRNPVSIQAETSGHNRDSFPNWSVVTYKFAPNEYQPGVKLTWYDGGKRPAAELLDGAKPEGCGALAIGQKGKLLVCGGALTADYKLLGVDPVEVHYPQSPGHFTEWVRAIQGGPRPMSDFANYGGPISEVVLTGNLAVWLASEAGLGPKVDWDAKSMRAEGFPELEPLVKPTYRPGYVLDA